MGSDLGKLPRAWAADTSWLYALLDKDEEAHAMAVEQAAVPGHILVNPIILAEFLDLVKGKVDRTASLLALREVLAVPHLRLVDAPRAAAMSRVVERHGRISWVDASAVCTALDEGAGLRTFDKNQKKAFEAMA